MGGNQIVTNKDLAPDSDPGPPSEKFEDQKR